MACRFLPTRGTGGPWHAGGPGTVRAAAETHEEPRPKDHRAKFIEQKRVLSHCGAEGPAWMNGLSGTPRASRGTGPSRQPHAQTTHPPDHARKTARAFGRRTSRAAPGTAPRLLHTTRFRSVFGRPQHLQKQLQRVGLELNEFQANVEAGRRASGERLDPYDLRRVGNGRNVGKKKFQFQELADA